MRRLFFSNAGIEWCLEHASGKSLCFVDELFRLEAELVNSKRKIRWSVT